LSKAGNGGRGNAFWDEAKLRRLRNARAAGIVDSATLRARFGCSHATLWKGVKMLAAQDAEAVRS